MKNSLPILAAAAVFLGAGLPSSRAAVPQIINYQGRIVSNGTNFNGTGQFKFVLLNGSGTPGYWSNGGAGSGTNQPATAVSIPVVNGLYSVLLGDTNVPNMAAIPLTAFNNTDVRLRVWFNNGVNGFQMLTPDQRVAAVGYALMAANVSDAVITSSKLANNAVTAANLASNSVTAAKIADNSITTSKLSDGAVTAAKLAPGLLLNAVGDDLNLGSNGVCGRLDVYSTDIGTPGVTIDGCLSEISVFQQVNGLETAELASKSWGGSLLLRDERGSRVLEAAAATSEGGYVTLWNARSNITISIDGHDPRGGGLIDLRNTNGGVRAEIKGEGINGGGEFNVLDASGTQTAQLLGAGASTGQGAALTLRQGNGMRTVLLDAEDGDNGGGRVHVYNRNGARTIDLNGDIDGTGTSRITTDVLQINGADFSERFDITPVHAELKPGMIVCIDPENPGRLLTSSKAYDTTVAGIISGAGGVRTGLLMGHEGTLANGEHPVALTGRVYCMVDAAQGAIRPGDLVTTSDTPGHGMRVTDPVRSHGAIIGKAMTGLSEGKGMVLVLVSLQ